MNIPFIVSLVMLLAISSLGTTYAAFTDFDDSVRVDKSSGGGGGFIAKVDNGEPSFTLIDVGGSSWKWRVADDNGRMDLVDNTENKLRIAVHTNGNVGIRTAGTPHDLDVKDSSTVIRALSTSGPSIIMAQAATGEPQFILDDIGSKKFKIRIGDGTQRLDIVDEGNGIRMSISSAGNVGIGKINALEKLDVQGNIRLTGDIVSPNDICIGSCP